MVGRSMRPKTSGKVIDRPVLLLGATRSGKTMVANLLDEQPDFSLACEPLTTWNVNERNHRDDVRKAADATTETTACIRHEIERFLARTSAARYLDDLPHHALRVPFCATVLPEARFIVVYRDGRDSIRDMLYGWRYRDTILKVWSRRMGGTSRNAVRLSRLPRHAIRWIHNLVRQRSLGRRRTWGPTVRGQHEFSATHTLVETVGYQWSQMIEQLQAGVAELPAEKVLEIRFEQMIADPRATFKGVAEFCEATDPEALVKLAVKLIDPNLEPDSQPLTTGDLHQLEPIIAPMQASLGYA
jgi:hypothetical protein